MSRPVLELKDLRVSYGEDDNSVDAVRGVDISVAPGEFVAVVGESGSGKSTTAHAVLGLLPETGRVTGGRIVLGDDDITSAGERRLRDIRGSRVGLVPQDPLVSLNPVMRVGAQVAETLRLHTGAGRRAAAARAVELLAEVGLPDPASRAQQYPHELSGGMRQRVLLANAWACLPELVIADEPTSALDVTVQRRVLDLLDAMRREHGTAVLFITHDLGVAAERADRIVVMRHGRVVETGTPAALLAAPADEYTRTLLAASPGINPTVLAPSARVVERAAGDLGKKSDPPEILLAGEGLTKSFPLPGSRRAQLVAVDGVDVELRAGRTTALVGESGSGKSTTARLLGRLADPTAGTVRYRGEDITRVRGEKLRAWRRQVQFVYQSPYASLDPRLAVGRIISEPLRAFEIGSATSRAADVRDLLEQVALPASVAERLPAALSGGQRQRVAIARALALRPELLILDEPVSALDASIQAQILQLLVDLRAAHGLTYLFISHDLSVVRQLADQVAVMREGRIVEQGPTEQLFSAPQHSYTQDLLAAIPRGRISTIPHQLTREGLQ
ncbi:dipeptide ABC transporter ATP-binding protein [Nakamurella sp. YIM 132087]|uniref:Dipeptide ABC transporter ATP-binding protein n=1 Tax=Nakamurella alba TaxID=2665158 RepID=A0A7K1FR63_9ACTN|nr:ABC transporter ATP-binding protein [Nakamurella alba]MTD16626.1 dipeptide ABC transporter ATP-binding protein [Nakamurella alba]